MNLQDRKIITENIQVPPCKINEAEQFIGTSDPDEEKRRTWMSGMYPRRVRCSLSFWTIMNIVFPNEIWIRTATIMDRWSLDVIDVKSLHKCCRTRNQRTQVIVQCKLIRDNPEEVGIDCLVSVLLWDGVLEENETDEECLLTAGLTLNLLQSNE